MRIPHDTPAEEILRRRREERRTGRERGRSAPLAPLLDDRFALTREGMSNAGLDAAIKAAGGRVVRTSVGDKNVIDEMLKNGYNLGGEQSGHLIFRDYSSTGDGLVAALQMLRIMKTKQCLLSHLSRGWKRYPQIVTNIRVREKKPFEQLDGVLDLVNQAEAELKNDGGRVLLRYSGTEPKARLLIEGKDKETLQRWSNVISDAVNKHVGI